MAPLIKVIIQINKVNINRKKKKKSVKARTRHRSKKIGFHLSKRLGTKKYFTGILQTLSIM